MPRALDFTSIISPTFIPLLYQYYPATTPHYVWPGFVVNKQSSEPLLEISGIFLRVRRQGNGNGMHPPRVHAHFPILTRTVPLLFVLCDFFYLKKIFSISLKKKNPLASMLILSHT